MPSITSFNFESIVAKACETAIFASEFWFGGKASKYFDPIEAKALFPLAKAKNFL